MVAKLVAQVAFIRASRVTQRHSLKESTFLLVSASGHVRDVDLTEEERTCLTAWIVQTMHTSRPELPETIEVDIEDTEAWRHEPNMGESDASELAAPAEGEWNCAD